MEKKYFRIGLILIFCVGFIFFLVKIFLPKKLPLSPSQFSEKEPLLPEEVISTYFSLIAKGEYENSENYLLSDFSNVEIFEENYRFLKAEIWARKRDFFKPELKFLEKNLENGEGRVNLKVKIAEGEEPLFFLFKLPKETRFEIDLAKEGGKWKIKKITSSELILESNFGKEIELKNKVFAKLGKLNPYTGTEIKPSEVNNKLLFLVAEFKNSSDEVFTLSPLSEWKITNKEGDFFYARSTENTEVSYYSKIKLDPGEVKKLKIFFEIPDGFIPESVIFQNTYKKIKFKID